MAYDDGYESRSTAYGRKVSKALLHLAEGYALERAATSVGVKHITLWAWMQEPDFAAVLACLQEYARMRRAFDALDGLMPDAVEAMRRTMKTGSPGQALEAARMILDRVQEQVEREQQAVEQARRDAEERNGDVVEDVGDGDMLCFLCPVNNLGSDRPGG